MTLNKTRFYAIKEVNTGLFLDQGNVIPKFFPLGERTRLFEKMSDAMARIEEGDLPSLMFFDNLEKSTGVDRWHAKVYYEEFSRGVHKYQFKVVPVELREVDKL